MISFNDGLIWLCTKDALGCDTIPQWFAFWVICAIIISFFAGYLMDRIFKKKKQEDGE